jgi:hypothetical protein
MRKIVYLILVFIPFLGQCQELYIQPTASFIHHPIEQNIDLKFNSMSVERVQQILDSTRLKNPASIIRITLTGNFVVSDAPIRLSDKMLLFLENVHISAKEDVTSSALIAVNGAEFVAITAIGDAILDGKNKVAFGIDICNAGKTHVDHIEIKNCTTGVYYSGRGMTEAADAGSVTRCSIVNCKKYGILYSKSFQFICTDNQLQSCGIGIGINGDYSAVSNNQVNKCNTGIYAASNYEAITYNKVNNCDTAFVMGANSKETLIAFNEVKHNLLGFKLLSEDGKIYNNDCDNTLEILAGGYNNQVFANKGMVIAKIKNNNGLAVTANETSIVYFNPPLIENEHKELIKIGKSRLDMVLSDLPLQSIRRSIDKAHQLNPGAVLVIHLNGNISTSGFTDSLLIKEDECVLFNGKISGAGTNPNLIFFKDKIISSFSGGTIDGAHLNIGPKNSLNALMYITGNATVIIDHVTLLNSGAEGITKRNSKAPTYINGCVIDSCRRRGLWQLAADRLFAFNNNITRTLMDGIDLDAYSTNSVIEKNVSSYNKRHGVFIEEGANHHIVIGNTLNSNYAGVHFFNKEVDARHTSYNLVAFNLCKDNNRGISLNAADPQKSTLGNIVFNNTCINNKDVGVGGFYNNTNTTGNYIAMMHMNGNTNGDFFSKAVFESNQVWNSLK